MTHKLETFPETAFLVLRYEGGTGGGVFGSWSGSDRHLVRTKNRPGDRPRGIAITLSGADFDNGELFWKVFELKIFGFFAKYKNPFFDRSFSFCRWKTCWCDLIRWGDRLWIFRWIFASFFFAQKRAEKVSYRKTSNKHSAFQRRLDNYKGISTEIIQVQKSLFTNIQNRTFNVLKFSNLVTGFELKSFDLT